MPESNSRVIAKDAAWQETWGSSKFIERWAAKGGWQAPIREVQTAMVLRMIPQPIDAAIRVLDIGAGYGALAAVVLKDRPNATAVCLDASEAMLDLGRERNSNLGSRIRFIQASLETPDWRNSVQGGFDAVISARALHHFTENQRRRFIFKEVFELVRESGCFINADNVRATTKTLGEGYRSARDEYLDRFVRESSGGKTNLTELRAASPSTYHGPHNNGYLEEELAWLREAGFEDVDCFWKFTTTVVYGGFGLSAFKPLKVFKTWTPPVCGTRHTFPLPRHDRQETESLFKELPRHHTSGLLTERLSCCG